MSAADGSGPRLLSGGNTQISGNSTTSSIERRYGTPAGRRSPHEPMIRSTVVT